MSNLKFIEDKDILKIGDDRRPRLAFPDFEGRKGIPSFVLCITPEKAEELAEAGYKVKHWENPNKEDDVVDQINIKMRFDNFPPKVYRMIEGSRTKQKIDADTLALLQRDYITKLECSITLSSFGGCYMDKGYFTIASNPLSKYEMDDEE